MRKFIVWYSSKSISWDLHDEGNQTETSWEYQIGTLYSEVLLKICCTFVSHKVARHSLSILLSPSLPCKKYIYVECINTISLGKNESNQLACNKSQTCKWPTYSCSSVVWPRTSAEVQGSRLPILVKLSHSLFRQLCKKVPLQQHLRSQWSAPRGRRVSPFFLFTS